MYVCIVNPTYRSIFAASYIKLAIFHNFSRWNPYFAGSSIRQNPAKNCRVAAQEAIHDALQNEAAKHPLAWIRIQVEGRWFPWWAVGYWWFIVVHDWIIRDNCIIWDICDLKIYRYLFAGKNMESPGFADAFWFSQWKIHYLRFCSR